MNYETNMNHLATEVLSEMPKNQLSMAASSSREEEISLPRIIEEPHKLIARNQNKMIAETTSDMFMSGLMCE